MGTLIVILVIAAVVYFVLMGDSVATKKKLKEKNRTPEQKAVIRYFFNDGCLQRRMKDEAYDKMLKDTLAKFDFRKRALDKIGLDESELQEIAPVTFQGPLYKSYARKGKDGLWRSPSYQVSWLFFSATQVYLYQYTLNMDSDEKRENTEEYFYKDITNFNTASETAEVETEWDKKNGIWKKENVDSTQFSLVVPGDKLFCAMTPSEETERSIKGMKAKLREKKTA